MYFKKGNERPKMTSTLSPTLLPAGYTGVDAQPTSSSFNYPMIAIMLFLLAILALFIMLKMKK